MERAREVEIIIIIIIMGSEGSASTLHVYHPRAFLTPQGGMRKW